MSNKKKGQGAQLPAPMTPESINKKIVKYCRRKYCSSIESASFDDTLKITQEGYIEMIDSTRFYIEIETAGKVSHVRYCLFNLEAWKQL